MKPLVFKKEDILAESKKYVQAIAAGNVFIYPTDTIYGIGCDATNDKGVQRIRDAKKRPVQPLSIWAPSKAWIKKHCKIEEKYLNMLPGPFTFLVEWKGPSPLSDLVAPGVKLIGVRLPDHWFQKVLEEFGKPIITTSVNKHGEKSMSCLEDLDSDIKVDWIVDEGVLAGKSSKIIDTTTGKVIRE